MSTTQTIIEKQFPIIEQLMQKEGLSQLVIESFRYNYEQVVQGATGYIEQSMISPIEDLISDQELDAFEQVGLANIDKLAIIKLNGGLGTTMGLNASKALLPAKNGHSFLEIIINQILYLRKKINVAIPLIFMNSFRTENDTLAALAQYQDFYSGQNEIPATFFQNKVPKIKADDFSAVKWQKNPELEWCPSGHGDIWTSLVQTGLLDTLLRKGYEYIFVSNGDNLSSTFCPKIFGWTFQNKLPWLSETTTKTLSDIKGGHLAKFKDDRLMLREIAQCPPEQMDDFLNVEKYKYFNINSLWVNLEALKETLSQNNNVLKLTLIRNEKNVDPTDKSSPKVYQLETAMGAAISCFAGARAINVSRARFTPVKDTGNLLNVWSDNYVLEESWKISKKRKEETGDIVVKLDPRYYQNITDFTQRFPNGAPSLIDCKSLIIKGDFVFGKNVVLKGNIVLENNHEVQKVIEDNTILNG
ncbi:MAG: UTP--glucose-1-phosphate uridylyltransferase [Deltaproteobacteria bacterium]|jgi:UTP--glucose-1-phosphate uridylyltransferase|nr:UTP--glucose-1-phosphate uridylyltransferase [Deltaproteobacteria bacterium]